MARLTYDSSIFTKVEKWDSEYSYRGILLSDKINQKNGQDYKLVDAIDIDWNGMWASFANTYIYDTKDLLDVLAYIDPAERLFEVNSKLTDIENAYVDKTLFNELIGHMQGALSPGEYITIDENNVITTYGLVSYIGLTGVLESYTTLSYLYNYAYDKAGTIFAINEKLSDLIGDANESFDSIKEIADWIMKQSTYDPVEYDDIDFSSGRRYFIIVEGKYVEVDEEYVQAHPYEQYYLLHSVADDVILIDGRLAYVETTIGEVTQNSDGSYTYTGIMGDLHNLEETTSVLEYQIGSLHDSVQSIATLANDAMTFAVMSYNTANTAYEMSVTAYEIAFKEVESSELAYAMAYSAYWAVGLSYEPGYYRELTEEEIEQINEGTLHFDTLYFYEEDGLMHHGQYNPMITRTWYVYVEPREATGMHKEIDDLTYAVETSLYNLSVDNSYAMSYVYLTMSPYEYEGEKERTIKMHAKEASISLEEGLIKEDGLITATKLNNVLSYIIDWVDIECEGHD